MITIYNESAEPWNLSPLSSTDLVSISRTKDLSPRRMSNPEEKIKNKSISIASYASMFSPIEDYQGLMKDAVSGNIKNIELETENHISFNRKTLRPFILDSKTKKKDILLCSIQVRGRKLINISSQDTYLLEYYLFSGEFSFIATFNSPRSVFSISLLDSDTGTITEYTFRYTEAYDSIYADVTTYPAEDGKDYGLHKIRRFRPNRPTHLILVLPEETEELYKIIDKTYHEVVEINDETFESVVDKLKSEYYRAVTIFTNNKYGFRSAKDANDNYVGLCKKIESSFSIVYRLYGDKKVIKLRQH